MYQIMLVEDEALVRESMAQNTNWEKFGFAPPHVFENGRQAADHLETVLPDVVITDICMPFLDGLELAKLVYERFPETIVVVLTGFSEFSYAQKAIRYHVHDYLLKPVSPKEFDQLLENLSAELSRRENRQGLYSRAVMADEVLKDHFFQSLLQTDAPQELPASMREAGAGLGGRELEGAAKDVQPGGHLPHRSAQCLVDEHHLAPVRGDVKQRSLRNPRAVHLLQAHRLHAELHLVLRLVAHSAMLKLHGVEPHREIRRLNPAALWIGRRLDQVALAAQAERVGEHRLLVQAEHLSPALDALRVHPLVLAAPLGRVRTLRPCLLIGQQGGAPQAVAPMGDARERDVSPVIHGSASPHPAEARSSRFLRPPA